MILAVWALAAVAGAVVPTPPNSAELTATGFDHFYNLEYPQAIADFARLTQLEPQNPSAWNHLSQAYLYQEMERVGALASELYGPGDPILKIRLLPLDPAAAQRFQSANQRALALAQAETQAHPSDAAAAYALAVAWGLRGTFDFVLRKAYWNALTDAGKARRAALRAVALRPDWREPLLILGVDDYIVGSLPWMVRWLAHLGGFSGNKRRGIARIHDVASNPGSARTEAQILMVVVDRREGWNRQAIPWLAALEQAYPRNVLFAVELGDAAEAAGQHAAATAAFRSVLARAAARAPGFQQAPLSRVWYQLGNIDRLFSRFPEALTDYRQAESALQAEPRYRQAAALAAGQVEDQLGRRPAALADYRRCIAINPDGPAAHLAERYLDHPFHPRKES